MYNDLQFVYSWNNINIYMKPSHMAKKFRKIFHNHQLYLVLPQMMFLLELWYYEYKMDIMNYLFKYTSAINQIIHIFAAIV